MAIGMAVRPPRIGGNNRLSGEAAGGFCLAAEVSGTQPPLFSLDGGSGCNWDSFSDMSLCGLKQVCGQLTSITRFPTQSTDLGLGNWVIL